MISAVRRKVDFRLAEHDQSMARLSAVMNRVGCNLSPADFIEAVSLAFQELQTAMQAAHTDESLRLDSSFEAFKKALWTARETQTTVRSVLVLGCGKGFAGKAAEFAARALKEVLADSTGHEIAICDLSPKMLTQEAEVHLKDAGLSSSRRYDLVVAHSLLHFIPNLDAFFGLAHSSIAPAGGLILGHEPNARFWSSLPCQQAFSEFRKQRSRRGFRKRMDISKLWLRISRRREDHPGFWEKLNAMLARRHGFRGILSENEIRRIVDVHRPEASNGDFRIGLDGFDLQQLSSDYLSDFDLVFSETSEHFGYFRRQELPESWQRRERDLAASYPHDGSVFTAYWKRKAA